MFNDFCFSEEVTDFSKFGTGHKRRKIVAVDHDRRILFIARLLQNRPRTTGKIRFDNNRSFDLRNRTVGKQKVSLFFCTDAWERRYLEQCEIEKAVDWMESAKADDINVYGYFVAEESGRPKAQYPPGLVSLARYEINSRLRELSLVQLQRLAGMLFASSDTFCYGTRSEVPSH